MENIFDYLKKGGRVFFVRLFFWASALITLHLVRFRKYKISSLRAFPRVSADWSQSLSVDADVSHSDGLTSATSSLSACHWTSNEKLKEPDLEPSVTPPRQLWLDAIGGWRWQMAARAPPPRSPDPGRKTHFSSGRGPEEVITKSPIKPHPGSKWFHLRRPSSASTDGNKDTIVSF